MPALNFKLEKNHNLFRRSHKGPGGVPPWMAENYHRPRLPSYLRIFGLTLDSLGAPLGNCAVDLFQTVDDVVVDRVVSDAGGNYEFRSASLSTRYYVVAYKPGSPDVAGTTINTLLGVG